MIDKLQYITLRILRLETLKLLEHSLGLTLPLFLPYIVSCCAVTYSKIWNGLVQTGKSYVKSYVPGMQLKDDRSKMNSPKMYLMISITTANGCLGKLSIFLYQISLSFQLIQEQIQLFC